MRIACCFSGHLRSFRQNTTLKAMLFDVNPPMAVFIHTYSRHNFTGKKWHSDDSDSSEPTTDKDIQWLHDAYPGIDPERSGIDVCEAGYEHMPAHLQNCGFRDTRAAVNELRQMYEQRTGKTYDLVCMMRFDIGLREPLIFPKVIAPNTLYAAYNYNMVRQGLDSDTITYGTPAVIDAINIPAVPEELADSIKPDEWCGEKLCTAVRKLRGIEYKTHKVKHFFYRATGTLEVDSHDPGV